MQHNRLKGSVLETIHPRQLQKSFYQNIRLSRILSAATSSLIGANDAQLGNVIPKFLDRNKVGEVKRRMQIPLGRACYTTNYSVQTNVSDCRE